MTQNWCRLLVTDSLLPLVDELLITSRKVVAMSFTLDCRNLKKKEVSLLHQILIWYQTVMTGVLKSKDRCMENCMSFNFR